METYYSEERKEKALNILKERNIDNLAYLGQGYEGVVFHDNNYVYKVVMHTFEGNGSSKDKAKISIFQNMKEKYDSFYNIEELIEGDNYLILKYKWEESEKVTSFSENDGICFLTDCWRKKFIVQDCKKENFIRVNGKIKLIDINDILFYTDDAFILSCVRMFIHIHKEELEKNGVNTTKLVRGSNYNYDYKELDGAKEFVTKVFNNIVKKESESFTKDIHFTKEEELVYEEYTSDSFPKNLEQLFYSKIKEELYLSDIQVEDINDNAKFFIGYKKLNSIKEKVSLLIKTCAQDCETIEANIKHIVKQLCFPTSFYEVVVAVDVKKENFLRQFNANPNFDKVIEIVKKLKEEKVIDRYFLYDPTQTSRVNKDWFNIETDECMSVRNSIISSTLYAFEQCKGDYILQADSDVMIGRRSFNDDYLRQQLDQLEKNDKVLSVGFNICNSEDKEFFGFENGGFVPEVRIGLFDKNRLLVHRPYPNKIGKENKMELSWYRSMERFQKENGYCSIRGGNKDTFYIHPQNYRKVFNYSWLNILDRVEQLDIPSIQYDSCECEGSYYDWCGHKRNENVVVIIVLDNTTIASFLETISSLLSQSYKDYGVIIYDNCSDNGIGLFAQKFLKNYKDKITLVLGRTKTTDIECKYQAIHTYCENPESNIIFLNPFTKILGKDTIDYLNKRTVIIKNDFVCGKSYEENTLPAHYEKQVNFLHPRSPNSNVAYPLSIFKKYHFDNIPLGRFKLAECNTKTSLRPWLPCYGDEATMIGICELCSEPYQIKNINCVTTKQEEIDLDNDIMKEILSLPVLKPNPYKGGRKTFVPTMKKIEIDITFDCNLYCLSCNRSCGRAPSKEYMSIEQIKDFIEESKELNIKWELINVLGGEPTMHPYFVEIIKMLQTDYADAFYNDTVIQVVSNGYVEKSRQLCKEVEKFNNVVIDYGSAKTTNVIEYFTPFADAPCDDKRFVNKDYSKACWTATYCGIGLNKRGYFGCAVCGAIDRVLNGKEGTSTLKSLTMDKIKDNYKKYCPLCGNYKHYDENNGDFVYRCEKLPLQDIISPTWEKIYKEYKERNKGK